MYYTIFDIVKKPFGKSFRLDIEPDPWPSVETVKEAILGYAKDQKEGEVRFVTEEHPLLFYMGDVLYSAEVGRERGVPTIYCVEKKEPKNK